MTVLGRTARLRPTRRLITLGVAVAALVVGLAVGSALLAAPAAGVALSVVGMPFLVEAGLWLVRPIERLLSRRWRRRALKRLTKVRPRVIAVTGSYGKTSTKEHIRDLLESTFRVMASPASWNNEAGLSRAINERLQPDTEVFVAEMGTYGRGEIRDLCSWIRPDVSVITAIGPVHLERMGSLDAILEAKAEILENAPVAVLAVDDPRLARVAERYERGGGTLWRAYVRQGGDSHPDGRRDVVAIAQDDEVTVYGAGVRLGSLPAATAHPVNVACSVAAALAVGTAPETISLRLPRLAPPQHRADVHSHNGLVIVDDTYNANPAGATAALARLVRAVPKGRRVVVSPGIVELGANQVQANREFARAVRDADATMVVVGWTNRKALLAGAGDNAVCVENRDKARMWVRSHLGPGDGILWENDLPDHYP